jgi:aryl-alcohol dehydrogenase-like predicted oxidoreductase
VLAVLDEIASELSSNPAAVSLAWMMLQPGCTAPIASATSVTQLIESMDAVRLNLSADMLGALDRASLGA